MAGKERVSTKRLLLGPRKGSRGSKPGLPHPVSPRRLGFSRRGGRVPRASVLEVLRSCTPSYDLVMVELELVRIEAGPGSGEGIRALARAPRATPHASRYSAILGKRNLLLQTHQKSSVHLGVRGPSHPTRSSRMAGLAWVVHGGVLAPGHAC